MKLGDRVRFTRHLTRRSTAWRAGVTKAWESKAYPGQPEPEPREGIVIGIRTLSNGRFDWSGYEDPGLYTPTAFFKAYLVAFDMRRNPVLVLPEHLELSDPAASVEA